MFYIVLVIAMYYGRIKSDLVETSLSFFYLVQIIIVGIGNLVTSFRGLKALNKINGSEKTSNSSKGSNKNISIDLPTASSPSKSKNDGIIQWRNDSSKHVFDKHPSSKVASQLGSLYMTLAPRIRSASVKLMLMAVLQVDFKHDDDMLVSHAYS